MVEVVVEEEAVVVAEVLAVVVEVVAVMVIRRYVAESFNRQQEAIEDKGQVTRMAMMMAIIPWLVWRWWWGGGEASAVAP